MTWTYSFYDMHTQNFLAHASVLHLVCCRASHELPPLHVLELILDRRPDAVLLRDLRWNLPLHSFLLEAGDDLDDDPFREILRLLLEAGGAEKVQATWDHDGNAVHFACRL